MINTHFFIDKASKRADCTTLDKPTTDTMTTLLKEEPLDQRKREENERETMLLLQEPTKQAKASLQYIARGGVYLKEKEGRMKGVRIESKLDD